MFFRRSLQAIFVLYVFILLFDTAVNYDTEYYNVFPRNTDLHIYKIWDYINDNRFKSKEYFEKEYQVS